MASICFAGLKGYGVFKNLCNEWMNEWCIYIALYCVLLYTQSALQSCEGGVSPQPPLVCSIHLDDASTWWLINTCSELVTGAKPVQNKKSHFHTQSWSMIKENNTFHWNKTLNVESGLNACQTAKLRLTISLLVQFMVLNYYILDGSLTPSFIQKQPSTVSHHGKHHSADSYRSALMKSMYPGSSFPCSCTGYAPETDNSSINNCNRTRVVNAVMNLDCYLTRGVFI